LQVKGQVISVTNKIESNTLNYVAKGKIYMDTKNNQNKDQWLQELDDLLLELSTHVKEKKLHFNEDGTPKKIKLNSSTVKKIKNLLLEHGPKYLYKYRGGTEKDLENLRTDNIWMAVPSEFNDPFDLKVYVNCELVAKELANNDAEIKFLMKTRSVTENNPIYIEFLNKIKTMENNLNKELTMKIDRTFISCLSEKRDSILMWSHYANNHKGFCIGYDFKKLLDLYKINMFPVTYSKDFFVIDTWEKFSNRINHMNIFMKAAKTKSLEWSYEKEWRIFGKYILNKFKQKGMLSKMPVPFSIYMGCHIENELENEIRDICQNKKINLYKMNLSKRSYNLIPYTILEW
jgi:hypothetical protein